jgi:hypothetical protein
MFPHVAKGGCTPKPRNESADSVRIASATPIVAETSTGATAFGTMCRKMMRRSGRPSARAATTKSCSRSERNSARTKRALPIHPVAPITIMML